MANARSENIITPEFRASFLYVFDREIKADGGEGAYSLLALFPKVGTDWRQDLPWLWAAIKEVLTKQFPNVDQMPPVFKTYGQGKPWPVGDGDLPNSLGRVTEQHTGHWVARMASNRFDPARNLLDGRDSSLGTLTPQTCFSGCYFKAQVNAYYYQHTTSIGVGLGLNNLMLTRPGEPFGGSGGGGQDAASAFGVTPKTETAGSAFGPDPAAGQPAAGQPAADPWDVPF